MTSRVRTQVLLERRQYERLKELSYRRGVSLSAALRDLLDEALAGGGANRHRVREARLGFVGSGRDPESDVADEHDSYLYGGS